MNISAISFQPYIYTFNRISAASMNRIQPIADDTAKSHMDFSGLTGENENPLRMGESKNFMDILSSQMAMSHRNEARIFQTSEAVEAMDVFKDQKAFEIPQVEMPLPADDMANPVDDMIVGAI
ncbi:MAG: hypothetical protein IJ485_02505 [Lachnospiraceae bacterium]|nr:hypothetical protein [Lachnospiraceae bacterium]